MAKPWTLVAIGWMWCLPILLIKGSAADDQGFSLSQRRGSETEVAQVASGQPETEPATAAAATPLPKIDTPFGGRTKEARKALLEAYGGDARCDRAVADALNWLARHQMPSGSWSIHKYSVKCKDPTCSGAGTAQADAAATGLALLPFLGAGQTHQSKGPYQKTIYSGLYWLVRQQRPDGDLTGHAQQKMYSHGIATIALCEAYGLSRDKMVGQAAQKAINFIQAAQHPRTGGWRYNPGDEGDTSVLGWQFMALKAGQMANLTVKPATMEGARRWLKSVAKGDHGGKFCYTPDSAPSPSMSAVGLLCSQYLGVPRDDPRMTEGKEVLFKNLPDNSARNCYSWYYATQVMHNLSGKDWDAWNRSMQKALLDCQVTEGCAAGSWDPAKPTRDVWGEAGGRLMVTSLSCLMLESYYRYLPVYDYQADGKEKKRTE